MDAELCRLWPEMVGRGLSSRDALFVGEGACEVAWHAQCLAVASPTSREFAGL